jgi:hypothetical protein
MTKKRRLLAVVAAAVLGTTGAVVAQSPASAAHGCEWPRVCFYLTVSDLNANRPTAAFQDVTSGWQYLGSRSRGAYYVYNSRRDDVAYLHSTNGSVHCLAPLNGVNPSHPANGWGTVDRIRISWSSTC